MAMAFRAVISPSLSCPGNIRNFFADVFPDDDHPYRMETFWDWLRLRHLLAETYFTFDPAQYNTLFDNELEMLIARVKDPRSLEAMRGFDWLSYVSSWVRHAGFRDYREVQERTHDVVVKLLTGRLFTGYDPRIHGPMQLRFKASVANAIRNLVAKEKTRRRNIPSVPIGQEFMPGSVTADDLPAPPARDDDSKVIEDFRRLVRQRLGGLGLAILDARLDGIEMKALVGSPALGSPGKWTIKKVVAGVKRLAREYAASLGDPEMLRKVERAMAGELETVGRRRTTMTARLGARA